MKQDFRISNFLQSKKSSSLPSKASSQIVILCYPDDEGVRLNHGRPGANKGPGRILYYLGKLNAHSDIAKNKLIVLTDKVQAKLLKARHDKAEETVFELLHRGYRVITLGGGHDYGYPDASAYYRKFKSKIVNVDAHLDVRPVLQNKINSGTPFFRFAERFSGKPIVQWGIQMQSNSPALFEYAKAQNMKVLSWQDPAPKFSTKLGMSICLDAIENIRGVSAPCLFGLRAEQVIKLIVANAKRSPWMGIYESAPGLDPQTEDSARLAAAMIWHYVHALEKR